MKKKLILSALIGAIILSLSSCDQGERINDLENQVDDLEKQIEELKNPAFDSDEALSEYDPSIPEGNPDEISEMLYNYYFNGGDLDTESLESVTGLYIRGREKIFVQCGNKGDAADYNVIDEVINISEDNITYQLDLPDGSSGEYKRGDISDISIIEYMPNIRQFGISYNRISDISLLKNYPDLEKVWLMGNEISDITPLENLTKLKEIELGWNYISDITPLKNHTNLELLFVYYNDICDVSCICNLSNLKYLSIDSCDITDISSLSALTKLQYFGISDTYVSDISVLKNFTALTRINIWDTDVTDISVLKNLTELTELYMGNSNTNDISFLSGLKKLEKLNIGSNGISDISPLKNLTELTELRMYDNDINDISVLSGLKKLEKLNIGNNDISDISVLKNLTELTELRMYDNDIDDISVLSGLKKLGTLNISNNDISDISVLKNLTGLTELYMDNSNVKDISILSSLKKLEKLNIGSNGIKDISTVKSLKELSEFYAYENKIEDISSLSGLKKLERLGISSNSISDISVLKNLTKLEWLSIGGNSIKDISAVKSLKELSEFYAYENKIEDISSLSGLKKLNKLSLWNNKIKDISVLNGLKDIEELYVSGNNISNYTPLEEYNVGIVRDVKIPMSEEQQVFLLKKFFGFDPTTIDYKSREVFVNCGYLLPEEDCNSIYDFDMVYLISACGVGIKPDYSETKSVEYDDVLFGTRETNFCYYDFHRLEQHIRNYLNPDFDINQWKNNHNYSPEEKYFHIGDFNYGLYAISDFSDLNGFDINGYGSAWTYSIYYKVEDAYYYDGKYYMNCYEMKECVDFGFAEVYNAVGIYDVIRSREKALDEYINGEARYQYIFEKNANGNYCIVSRKKTNEVSASTRAALDILEYIRENFGPMSKENSHYGHHPTGITVVNDGKQGGVKIILKTYEAEMDRYSGDVAFVYDVSSRETKRIFDHSPGNETITLLYNAESKTYALGETYSVWGSMEVETYINDLSGNNICHYYNYPNYHSDKIDPEIGYSIYDKKCTEEEYNKFLERYTKIEMTDCSEFSVVDFMDYIKDGLKNVGVY